ncbi:MAG: hypothetical protein HYS34_07785 [Acidobacteria bacterium]|nr:hypothetical protein [Acidobacteriota bacterium]
MGFPAIASQAAQAHPALLLLLLGSIPLTLWACKQKRWMWAAGSGAIAGVALLLYVGAPDRTIAPTAASAAPVASGQMDVATTGAADAAAGTKHALAEPGRFSSTVRLHPRFPRDFPIPRVFRLESNSGGIRGGNLTVRFRFRGEASNAVCDLRTLGRKKGWAIEVLAPHRLIFRKDGAIVEAWFSFPARSVVLDIADSQ